MAFQRILVPVDGSATANRGLKEAIELAKAVGGGQLIVVHVVENAPLITAPEAATYLPQLIDDLRAAGKKVAGAAKARAEKAGVPCEAFVIEGEGRPVYESIVQEARRRKANVIVLGTHGRRGIARVLMGSDAEGVVRESTVPVLLIRAPAD
jgi:nucleotide-binding universal stress UspA family protein